MRNLVTALTVMGFPLVAWPAMAADAVPAGTTATIGIRMTVKEQAKSDWHSSVIEHVFSAQCVMMAGHAAAVGPDGMTAEQQAKVATTQNQIQDYQQQYAPSDDMLAQFEAGAEACGEDEACLTALAMKMSQTPEMQAMAQQVPEAQAAMAAIDGDLGPARYQTWESQSCSGAISVNDVYVDSDPGGEGGDGAYTDTITASGTAPLMEGWRGVFMHTDTLGGTTTYQIMTPPPVSVPASSSMNGAQQRQVEFLQGARLPEKIGPLGGVMSPQSAAVKTDGGTVMLEIGPN
jgi:hypothetical protein